MWCLALHLPLLVGDYVPEDDEHRELLCVLLAIIRIAFAPTISENQVAYLQKLIQEHHEKFKELFPQCNVIPKIALYDPYAKNNITVSTRHLRTALYVNYLCE